MKFSDLVQKNRSYRGYDQTRRITREELLSLVDLARKTPSAVNRQPLRFRLVTDAKESSAVCRHMRLGAALPKLHLPFPGTEPTAFILLCADTKIVKNAVACAIDVGIAAQTILLGAVDMGLGGIMISNFDRKETAQLLQIPDDMDPALLIALGLPNEEIVLEELPAGSSTKYWRENGVHHVPKRRLEDVLL